MKFNGNQHYFSPIQWGNLKNQTENDYQSQIIYKSPEICKMGTCLWSFSRCNIRIFKSIKEEINIYCDGDWSKFGSNWLFSAVCTLSPYTLICQILTSQCAKSSLKKRCGWFSLPLLFLTWLSIEFIDELSIEFICSKIKILNVLC